MNRSLLGRLGLALALIGLALPAFPQSAVGSIQGVVRDEQQAVTPGVAVTIRNVDTNLTRTLVSDGSGRYRALNLPPGPYEVTAELTGFARVVRSGITLMINQDAVVDFTLKAAAIAETITVQGDAPLLNTTNAEVGVRFDTKRISELPVGNSRDVFSLALQAAGVSQTNTGQSNFASGPNFASNGMRTRSNNFMIDGQDSNDPSVTGRQQPINNTDTVSELRLITNQFTAEYGRAAGSVVNVITKSGTNTFHGSAFWFLNRNDWNAMSNLDKAAGRTEAPFREDDQYGATLGGPIVKDNTFFFGGYQHWTQKFLGSGFTLNGAPTEAGRAALQAGAGSLPQVQALLKFLPAGSGFVKNASFSRGGQTFTVPLGSITGSSDGTFTSDQYTTRLDQRLGSKHNLSARYLRSETESGGTGQVTPPGLTTVNVATQQSAAVWLTSTLASNVVNEFRVAFSRLSTETNSADPSSEEIPSLEINELGLVGFNAAANRTAIGLAVNLPQWRKNDLLQIQDTFSYIRGNHAWKTGFDLRMVDVDSFFNPTLRGRLVYPTLQRFVDDVADVATINGPLPGGQTVVNYAWNDAYFFLQDEWRVRPNLTLNLGVRYELPGNWIDSLQELNDQVVAAAGGDPRYALSPVPERDTNNVQPRLGFNWTPQTSSGGLLGFLTGGDKLVVRGGYARTNDYAFLNIALNIASSFPYVASVTYAAPVANAFVRLPATTASGLNPLTLTRTIVDENFVSPYADQFSFELQRQLSDDMVFRAGYIGTRGHDLFQTLDGNPRRPFSTVRQDPTRGIIRQRANAASSWYDSLQLSLDKRVSKGFSAGFHYTYSKFIDTASEIFNVSSAEVAVAQDSFDIAADKGRSSFDRPHRFTGNFVWELPVKRSQEGAAGKLLGGWQLNSTFTFQSGSPFSALNGADPTGALSGIDGLVGSSIRPMLNTNLDISNMTIQEIKDAGGASLFRQLCGNPSATCPGERVGNVPRNILRSDGVFLIDFSVIKNTRIMRNHTLQFRLEMFNATNSRNFGIPDGRINSANFLNEKGTDGGNRTIWLSARYIF
ncbi:MAG: carboxypeptidase regulatory-like domain-containing protein [Vicinamibacteria bacterium]